MGNDEIAMDTLYEDMVEKWIKQCIHMRYSPKLLLEKVFNTIDKEIDFGETKMVLYCGSYGGYGYSQEFAEYIKTYHNKKLDGFFYKDDLEIGMDEIDGREQGYLYVEQFAKHLNISIGEALKRASGKYCELKVKIVPKHREYLIHEYDGCESVEILKDITF